MVGCRALYIPTSPKCAHALTWHPAYVFRRRRNWIGRISDSSGRLSCCPTGFARWKTDPTASCTPSLIEKLGEHVSIKRYCDPPSNSGCLRFLGLAFGLSGVSSSALCAPRAAPECQSQGRTKAGTGDRAVARLRTKARFSMNTQSMGAGRSFGSSSWLRRSSRSRPEV